jgi:hypothetical protein
VAQCSSVSLIVAIAMIDDEAHLVHLLDTCCTTQRAAPLPEDLPRKDCDPFGKECQPCHGCSALVSDSWRYNRAHPGSRVPLQCFVVEFQLYLCAPSQYDVLGVDRQKQYRAGA